MAVKTSTTLMFAYVRGSYFIVNAGRFSRNVVNIYGPLHRFEVSQVWCLSDAKTN